MKMLTDKLAIYFFIIPMGVFGFMHVMNADAMAGMVPAWVPGGVIWVYFTGICLLAATIAVIMNKKAQLALLLLGVLLLIFATTIHLAAVIGGDQMAMGSFLKDFALAGAAFYLSGKADA
jgi:putative oxidoreductase